MLHVRGTHVVIQNIRQCQCHVIPMLCYVNLILLCIKQQLMNHKSFGYEAASTMIIIMLTDIPFD